MSTATDGSPSSRPDVFLRLNGWRIEATADAAYDILVGGLERGRLDREVLEEWLRSVAVEL